MTNQQQLELLVNNIYMTEFKTEFPKYVPIKLNGRLSRTQGMMKHKGDTPVALEISTSILHNMDDLIDTIKHECLHLHLLLTKGVEHCGHTKEFNDRARAMNLDMNYIGASKGDSTKTYRIYCGECGKSYARNKNMVNFFNKRYICPCGCSHAWKSELVKG
jgi:predicted SprT family Zn-dependent metalloprotease